MDPLDKSRHSIVGLARDTVEIAVMALVKAERDVDVKRSDLNAGKLFWQNCRALPGRGRLHRDDHI